ncbi:MAG: LTA synthase family protein [Eubacteriales bacterium]|nr:LTA synthase family protein [Eubacteriales bacterium]
MKKKRFHFLWYILFGLIFVLAETAIILCAWYHKTYNVGFRELLYTLLGPLKGTGNSVIELIVSNCLPPILWCLAGCILVCFLLSECQLNQRLWTLGGRLRFPAQLLKWLRRLGALGCVALLFMAVGYANLRFDIVGYLASLKDSTDIYEREYVDPASVSITAPEKKRNLIYIVAESLETTYMSTEEGGMQAQNLMPRLTELARSNLYFSGTQTFSGLRTLSGTSWTIASLLSQTSGIPFAFPVDSNAMETQMHFAPRLITLGDILQDNGYAQEFVCGSDASFGGRRKYFAQHGAYEIFDLFTAREQGYIPPDYYVWWGFEDMYLFDIARDEATRLAEQEQPFNLTLLTVDLHHFEGYICPVCGGDYGYSTADVVNCTDRQIADFVAWCQDQPFWENTTIIVTGDHPRMDGALVEEATDAQRTIYHCILNAPVEVQGSTEERTFTTMDLFPTTLAAMGFQVEGDRLGLGVNLFSDLPTLAERMGAEALSDELVKHSSYYLEHFYYNADKPK